jgi:hypothetical protein
MNARTLIALLLAATAAGCVGNYAPVVISTSCFPPTPTDNGLCSYPATCDSVWLGNFAVDAAFTPVGGTPLVWPLQLENQRSDNGAREGGTNTASAYVTGFKLKFGAAGAGIPEVSVAWNTQLIQPSGSTVMVVPVVPAAARAAFAALPNPSEVHVDIRATGHYGDGSSFETAAYKTVVDVLNGGYLVPICPTATPTYVGSCPQEGQSSVPLCK